MSTGADARAPWPRRCGTRMPVSTVWSCGLSADWLPVGTVASVVRDAPTDFLLDVFALFDDPDRQLTVGASTGTHARLPLLIPGGSASAQSTGEADWSQAHRQARVTGQNSEVGPRPALQTRIEVQRRRVPITGYRPLWRALRRPLHGRRHYGHGHGRGLTQVVQQLVLHGPPVALAQGGRSVVGRHVWSLSAEASTSSASAM
jgi:hypothetical protein